MEDIIKMTEVMVDLETYSTNSDALIITIGAIKFSRKGNLQTLEDSDKFYRRITIESSRILGLNINPETVLWWSQQSKESRYEIETDEDRVPIQQALKELNEWFGCKRKIWGHGSVFDCIILENSYKACNIEAPWNFWDVRDSRTMFDIGGIKMKDLPTKGEHHALYDAYRQIIGVKQAFENIKKRI
jgi:DNA polymerase III epsilon subunit-like protein